MSLADRKYMYETRKYNKNLNIFLFSVLILILAVGLYIVTSASTDKNIHVSTNKSISNVTPVPTSAQSKFITTYTDTSGNLHQIEDYTSQGGAKYDTIIKSSTDIVNTPVAIKIIKPENKNSDILSDIKNSIINFYNENKPRQKANSNLIGTWKNNAQVLDVPLPSTMTFTDKYVTLESSLGQAVSEYYIENDKVVDEKGRTIFLKFYFIDGRTLITENSGLFGFGNTQLIWHKTSWW